MRVKQIMIILSTFFMLAACGQDNTNSNNNDEDALPKAVNVDLDVPSTADVNEEILLKATVTQGEEMVDDADSVDFEVWEKGKKEATSKMIPYEESEDGSYSVMYEFTKDAIYEVQVHVEARKMHVMPKTEIQVGDVDYGAHQEHADSEEGHHHHSSLEINFDEGASVTAGQKQTLAATISKEGDAFTDASVQYEIWRTSKEKHDWVKANEVGAGTYKAEYIFAVKGEYNIQIHVKHEDGTHEHKVFAVEVL